MIRCIFHKNPFDHYQRDRWIEAWSDRATVRGLLPPALREVDDAALLVRRNGAAVPPEQWGHILAPDDVLEFGLAPAGPLAFAAATAAGSIAPTAAATTAAVTVQGALINVAISTALAALVGILFRQKPPRPGDAESPTYGFGGVSANPAFANAAFPMVFGEMRVAGPIVNLYTDVLAGADEYLHMLVMVAGHKVLSIGGIDDDEVDQPFTTADGNLPKGLEIDGEPAENFLEVECHVRLGKDSQELIPGFAAPTLQYAIEREIRESEEPAEMEQVAGVYAFDDGEITAWDTPTSVTTEIEADAFSLLIRFPAGLYRMDADSTEVKLRTVRFQVRYRRAKNGNPFGDYVVLPAFDVTAKKNGPFTFPYARDFIDPASYVEPTPGYYLDLTGAANDVAHSAATTLATQDADETEFTLVAWVRLTNYFGEGSTDFDTTNRIFFHIASNRGFSLSLIGTSPLIGTADLTQVIMRVGLGNGTSTTSFDSDTHSALVGAFNEGGFGMLAITYRADVKEDGSGELTYHVNGKHIQTRKIAAASGARWPTSGTCIAGASSTAGAESLDGGIDEVLVYDRALSDIEIASMYQGGAPEAASASQAGIVAGWHFDDTNTGGTTTPDFVASADMTLTNGANISSLNTGTDVGPVFQAASGSILRDRFLVEIQRTTAKDSDDFAAEDAQLGAVQLRIYDEFEFPSQALLALRIRATGQTNGVPSVTVPVRGYDACPIWDGIDPNAPTFIPAWSRNPAWIFAAAAIDTKLGAGNIWRAEDIDWQSVDEAADYFDELVAANEEQDADGAPTPLYIAITDIDILSAASAVAEDAAFVDGMVKLDVDDTEWPATYPGVFGEDEDSIAIGETEHWLRVTGVDVTGVPQEIRDLEGLKLAIGRCDYSSTGGPGGMGGGAIGGFQVWCHTPADPGADDTHTPATGEVMTIDRWEPRMECDVTFDRTDMPRWDALLTILKSARATPLPRGRKLSLWFDAPREIDNMLVMGNAVVHSFSTTYSGVADRPNVIEGTFLDRDRSYEQVPVQARHPAVVNPSVLTDQRVAQESFEGITRRTQLERHLRYKLNWYHLARRMYEARGGPDLIGVAPGHRLHVSHDVPGWGRSGRLIQASPGSGLAIYLDREVTIESGETYTVTVRDAATGTLEERVVDSATGTYSPGDSLSVSVAFSFAPQKDDLYAFGATERAGMDYLVIETGLVAAGPVRTIKAVQYDEQVYADAWGEVPAAVISFLDPPEVA